MLDTLFSKGKVLAGVSRLLFGPYAKKILSGGKRYDPKIAKLLHEDDKCHIERYFFAKKYIRNNHIVLDIACGTGYGSAIVSDRATKVYGVDNSLKAIKYAKNNYRKDNIEFINADFFQNKIKADVVLCFETLEHLKGKGMDEALKKLVSFSRKIVIGSVPYREKEGNNPYHYFFDLDESSFKLLKKYGKVNFFYQSTEGKVNKDKRQLSIVQNLIFLLINNKGLLR